MPPSLRSSLNCNIILLPDEVSSGLLLPDNKIGAVVSSVWVELFVTVISVVSKLASKFPTPSLNILSAMVGWEYSTVTFCSK